MNITIKLGQRLSANRQQEILHALWLTLLKYNIEAATTTIQVED